MRYLLDSDTLNYVIKGHGPARENARQAARSQATFILSPAVDYEVRRWIRLRDARRLLRTYEAVTGGWQRPQLEPGDWEEAIRLWAERHRRGKPIADSDLLIAVMALRLDATVVTNNTAHFEGLGVRLENWARPPA